jgi:hypothetical protein
MMASTITPELQPKTSGHVQACIDGIASRGRDEPEISSRRHKWSSSSFSRNLQMLSGGRDLTGESNKRSCVGSDEMSLRKLRQMSEEFESESEIEETEELEVSRTPQPEWLNVTTDIAQILDEMMYEFCETTEFESESKIEATDKLEVLKNNNSGSSSEGGAANITAQRGTPLPNAAVQHDPVITCPRQKKPPKKPPEAMNNNGGSSSEGGAANIAAQGGTSLRNAPKKPPDTRKNKHLLLLTLTIALWKAKSMSDISLSTHKNLHNMVQKYKHNRVNPAVTTA